MQKIKKMFTHAINKILLQKKTSKCGIQIEENFSNCIPHCYLKKVIDSVMSIQNKNSFYYRFPPRAANKTTTNGPAARIKTRLVS